MPKFNEFIKGFEETAPKAQEPKENRDQIIEKVNQKMMNAGTYGAFGDKENYEKSIAEAEELRKGLAPKAEEPKAPKYKLSSYFGKNYSGLESSQELDDDIENAIWDKTMKGNFVEVEEPETGKKWRFSPDIEDPYDIALDERFEYGRPAPKANSNDYPYDEKGQRIVNYGGKDMTLDEAKEEYKKAVAIPTLKRTPESEAYLDKSAEYDIAQDELYKKWYEEKDPQKKAELKEQMDNLDKEYARFLDEWEEAERNRYKKSR